MRVPAHRTLSTVLTAAGLVAAAGLPTAAAVRPALESYATPGDGVFRIVGSGWGHGRGMSQWGAHQAATEGAGFAKILAFYYPGTVLSALPAASVRVLISGDTGPDLVVAAAPGLSAREAGAGAAPLPSRPRGCATAPTRWRVAAAGSTMRLDAACGRWVTVDPDVGPSLTFAAPSGMVTTHNRAVRRAYRGVVSATRVATRSVRVVNEVPMEQYLRSVVAAEVSPSWPMEALKAQAIAARTYAAREAVGRAGRAFDVYDSTRSQVYRGVASYAADGRVIVAREHPRTDAAVAATAGKHVTANGAPVLTQFSASNGGATAASPLPHMVVAADGWDARATRNPRLSWTRTVRAGSLARRYRLGSVTAIQVLGREGRGPWGGRVTAVRLVGTAGSRVLTGDAAIRSGLGVSSSMLTISGPA